jgi:ribosome-binding protein aMBF1 (putative translation factor)
MDICSKCEREKKRLFDIVSAEGIVRMCLDCLQDDEVPVVKKPLEGVFEDSNSKKNVYERLSSAARINSNETKIENEMNSELKEIVNKNLQFGSAKSLEVDVDLIRNFHWIVMRARRLKKLTLSELSKKIAEPEEVLKMIERGNVSEQNIGLIKKLELFLGIQILTDEARKKIEIIPDKKIGFDPVTTQSLTIDDLREMKKQKEEQIFEEEKIEDYSKKEELSQKDIDDLIFGRRG